MSVDEFSFTLECCCWSRFRDMKRPVDLLFNLQTKTTNIDSCCYLKNNYVRENQKGRNRETIMEEEVRSHREFQRQKNWKSTDVNIYNSQGTDKDRQQSCLVDSTTTNTTVLTSVIYHQMQGILFCTSCSSYYWFVIKYDRQIDGWQSVRVQTYKNKYPTQKQTMTAHSSQLWDKTTPLTWHQHW